MRREDVVQVWLALGRVVQFWEELNACSETHFCNVGFHNNLCYFLESGIARAFLENFCYGAADVILEDWLVAALGQLLAFRVDTPLRFGISQQKAPHNIWKWLDGQMGALLSKAYNIEL